MKKITLALTVLLSLGLSACSSQSQKDESAYKGQVIFTEFQGDDVKLTVRKNDCSYKQEGETEVYRSQIRFNFSNWCLCESI